MKEEWPKTQENIPIDNHHEDRERFLEKEQPEFIEDVFKKAEEKGIDIFLIGGFADEAVLNGGEIKRKHEDVDFVCMRKDMDAVMALLSEVGCEKIKKIMDGQNFYAENLPLKIAAQRGGMTIDVPLLDFDELRQQPYYFLINNEGKKFTIYFEKNIFSDGKLGSISPLGLIQTRIFYPSIENIEIREKDRVAAEMLRSKFFPNDDLSDSKFMPEIIEIK